jgi:hypothetical protein
VAPASLRPDLSSIRQMAAECSVLPYVMREGSLIAAGAPIRRARSLPESHLGINAVQDNRVDEVTR